jgi:hypothetical protein
MNMSFLSTKINQDIYFIDTSTWKVYEHYTINGKHFRNQLGFFNTKFQYQPIIETPFLERRGNFQGYKMKAMTEDAPSSYNYYDLSTAKLDETSQTYDVTHLTKGMFYDIFMILQDKLNFTATLHKREDSKFGYAKVLPNGTIITSKLHADVAEGDADFLLARYTIPTAIDL